MTMSFERVKYEESDLLCPNKTSRIDRDRLRSEVSDLGDLGCFLLREDIRRSLHVSEKKKQEIIHPFVH